MEHTTTKSMPKKDLIIVIVIMVILFIAFTIGARMQGPNTQKIQEQQMMIQNDTVTQQAQMQGTTDDVTSIDADLKATNIDGLDK